MRLSTYEIILPLVGTDEKPIEGYTLLTNGLYGAVDVVPKEDADKLQAGDFAGLPATAYAARTYHTQRRSGRTGGPKTSFTHL